MLVAHAADEQNVAIFDGSTVVHASVGVTAGLLGISTSSAVLASIGVEFAYLSLRDGPKRAAFDRVVPATSLANHAADVVATVAGVYLGRWLVHRAK